MSGNQDQILSVISDGVVFIGPSGAPRFVNPAARELLGSQASSIAKDARIQKRIDTLRSGAAKPPLECALEIVREQEIVPVTVRILDWKAGGGFVLVFSAVAAKGTGDQSMALTFELLRKELTSPIKTFIERANQALGRTDAGAQLQRSGAEVMVRLAKLVALAELFGTDVAVRDERIEMRTLIDEVWPELQPLAASRFVAVSVRGFDPAPPAIYGTRAWVRRALAECIDNAIRHARSGTEGNLSQIEVVATLQGVSLAISIKNVGLGFLPRRTDREFLPFGRAGDGEAEKKLGVGLALAARVCELHNGRLEIGTRENELVECTLQFPTGAPARASVSIEIAQAQKYAADLAKLLARRHKAPKTHTT